MIVIVLIRVSYFVPSPRKMWEERAELPFPVEGPSTTYFAADLFTRAVPIPKRLAADHATTERRKPYALTNTLTPFSSYRSWDH